MDIDITDLRSRELIRLLNNYPQGHLEIKYERVFWCSDYLEPETASTDNGRSGNRPSPYPRGMAGAPQRALDALGSMVGPPGR